MNTFDTKLEEILDTFDYVPEYDDVRHKATIKQIKSLILELVPKGKGKLFMGTLDYSNGRQDGYNACRLDILKKLK